MRISVRSKLMAAFLFISLLTALFIYVLVILTSEQRIQTLTRDYQMQEMSQEVQHWYAAEGDWQGFADYFKQLHPPRPARQWPAKQSAQESELPQGVSRRHGLVAADGKALLRYLNYQPGETVARVYLAKATPVSYQGQTIAWIIPPDVVGLSLDSEMQVFFDNFLQILQWAVVVAVLVSVLLGLLLARLLLKPVESLNRAAQSIARGNLAQSIPVYADDEIGDLSHAFNKMSQDLFNADKQRRQLTADITHDLGTPVQVISGYIEMAQDGALDLDASRIDTIATELVHVQRLLKDMSLLSETDAKTLSLQMAKTDVGAVLQRVVCLYQQACQERRIALCLDCHDTAASVVLDEERLVQVVGNLISNAMRYTPPGGEIRLQTYEQEGHLFIEVIDTGSGIDPQDLPYIFDRFYRSDRARAGDSGKSGLGLAISRGLVENMGGVISAYSDGKNGSCFQLCFQHTPS